MHAKAQCLPVGLGNTLNLVLLLDCIAVGRSLGSIDDLLSKALSDGFDVAECSIAGTSGQQPDGLVDTTERRDIDGLTAHDTSGTDAARILTRTRVHDGIDDDLDWVLAGEESNDVAGVTHDAHSEHLLTVVATVHHQRVGHALHDRALSLLEALLLPATSRVGQVASIAGFGGDVILQAEQSAAPNYTAVQAYHRRGRFRLHRTNFHDSCRSECSMT